MSDELIRYIITYGYPTIFSLVFLQEVGIPNPVPNEFILLFSGYLTSTGQLSFFKVISTVVIADFIGTAALYFIFYFFGTALIKKAPKWLPIAKIESIKHKLSHKGLWSIYAGRLIPYVRGYTSVAAGAVRLPPKVFLPAVLFSAITWSGGYVFIGKLLGPRWESVSDKIGWGNSIAVIVVGIVAFVIAPKVYEKIKSRKKNV